ncbi:MAG: VWA domain-containing protein [Gemmataceae bacterium]|nr:VWA domain-containing protein [Gemmataceae bacterium]
MNVLRDYLSDHWLAVALLTVGIALFLWRRRVGAAFVPVMLGLGGLFVPASWGFWLLIGAGGLLTLKCLYLLFSTRWYAGPATALAGACLVGAGAVAASPTGDAITATARTAGSFEVISPFWLAALATIPVVIWLSRKSLAGLGPVRRWVVVGLRCLVIALLALALAEVRLKKPGENTTVLFLVDRSLSVPSDIDPTVGDSEPLTKRDLRWKRIKQFLNDSVAKRGPGHEQDQSGVIVFGRRPRLILPPAEVPRLNFAEDVLAPVDENYTDIGAAIKLAIASFPEGSGRRIVLLSDGNENLGNAEEQARAAAANGVQIDVVPLAAGYRNENEVLVQRVEAPTVTEQGGRLPIRVLLRSYNPNVVTGELSLRQLSEGETVPVVVEPGAGVVERGPPAVVQLRPGLNSFSFKQSLAGVQRGYTYQAVFTPKSVQGGVEAVAGLPGDRVQNNSATTHVLALGRRRVLFVESRANSAKSETDHRFLIDQLQGTGDTKFQVSTIHSGELPANKSELGVFLSNYDCVVLANVPAEDLSTEQMEMIRSNTYDQGCGLVMIGGPDSYGAGGYQGTAIEKALPVDCEIQAVKVAGRGGLVLIMHASEAADGNALQKQVAKLAIQKLSPVDMVGVLWYDGTHKWNIPFRQIGSARNALFQLVDRMTPGDMPDFDPALQLAYLELTKSEHKLATKHIILISDGDPSQTNANILRQMRTAGVTCTTVGVATHGAPESQRMSSIAAATGGRFYNNPTPKSIPAIYVKETRTISQSFISENRFAPKLLTSSGPTDRLQAPLPALYGFVRTSLKQSPLVEMSIEGPSTFEQRYPILASWQYGLGKAVAYTSDARSRPGRSTWDQEWAGGEMYKKFWEQTIGWAIRGVESGKLAVSSEYRDGKVRVTVEARDDRNRPLTDLRLKGGVTAPNAGADSKPLELKFEQRAGGVYEAEFKAEEAGSYFVNAQAIRSTTVMKDGKPVTVEETDSVRSGVTVPYSPEFADLESNAGLMKKLAAITGGDVYEEDDKTLARAAASGAPFRKAKSTRAHQPVWFWLVLAAGLTFLADVAVRRIAVESAEVREWCSARWDALRGRTVEKTGGDFLERLQSKKSDVSATIEQARATKRFEPTATDFVPPPPAVEVGPAAPPRPVAPAPAAESADDAFARLMKAKRKALDERGRTDEPPT